MELPKLKALTFEERDHVYRLDGNEIPSVTTLMKPLNDWVYGGIKEGVLETAAERGTSVHESCESYVLFGAEDYESEYEPYFLAFKDWWDEKKPKAIATEHRVYHKILRYAGTCDLLCEIDGKITLVDYKTTSQVNSILCAVQLEGYSKAWESQGIKIEDQMILHLQKTGKYKEHHYPRSNECWLVMSALLTIYNYIRKHRR